MQLVSRRAVVGGLLAAPAFARTTFARPGCPSAAALEPIADALLAQMPELAVYNGVPAASGGGALQRRFDDYSPTGEAALRGALRTARAQLGTAPCPAGSDGRHIAVARAILDNGLRSADIPYGHLRPLWFSAHEPYVVSQISGPHIDSANQMAAQQAVGSVVEAEAYLDKLRDFPRALDGAIAKIRADAGAGCVPPQILMTKALAGIEAFVAPRPVDHPLVTGMAAKMRDARFERAQAERFAQAAAEAVRSGVYPAYGRLRAAVAELAVRGKAEHGLWAQPRGAELYAANVASLGDTRRTPEEIHRIGLDEVARITGEMDALLRRQGYASGSVGARMAALGKEPRVRYPDSDAGRAKLLDDVRAMVARAAGLYPRFLSPGTIPRQQVEVRRVPIASQDGAPGAYYDSPSLDGTRPGIYWLNLRDMADSTRIGLPTVTYHEAVPGHHTQSAVALSQGEVPLLMKLASFNAYSEGWALYAERLMSELGAYADDPVGDLGRLQDELFRAVRLVVDTGLHQLRWSREKAIDYGLTVLGSPPTEVTAEIERYMAWPGQALGYKLGQLRLIELREAAKQRLGAGFDVRDFHDAVLLGGAAPLSVIETAVGAMRPRRA